MNRSNILHVIEKINESVINHKELLRRIIAQDNKKIAGYITPVLPPEIMAAFDIELLKIPETVISGIETADNYSDIFTTVILPDSEMQCFNLDLDSFRVYRSTFPEGYGEDAAVALHNGIDQFLSSVFNLSIKSINIEKLQKKTAAFELLRRTVRAVSALRAENMDILTEDELSLIFEAAQIFPADIACGLVSPLLDELKRSAGEEKSSRLKALFAGGRRIPSDIADFIQSRGIALTEDDTCAGRRFFDISLNHESEYLFYELLDAYTYRPANPCTRKANERYELLYKLLRNYGIDLVILFDAGVCGYIPEHIEYLRIRLMRDGVDPLVINSENYVEVIDSYMRRI